jgi:alpha-tubulin suppressor-like RCC1 family protein
MKIMRKTLGSLYTWGDAYHTKLGHFVTQPLYVPTKVTQQSKIPSDAPWTEYTHPYLRRNEIPLNEKFVKVATGPYHTACISEDYKLYTFGQNDFNKLGHSYLYPQIPGLVPAFRGSLVADVACGLDFTVVATESGKLFTWGYGGTSRSLMKSVFYKESQGALGQGDFLNYSQPTLVEGLNEVVQVAAGHHHALGLTASGHLYTWGNNHAGQTGHGDRPFEMRPHLLMTGISRIAAAGDVSAALTCKD